MKKLILSLIVGLFLIALIPVVFAQSCQTIVEVSVSPYSIDAGDCITISGRVYSSYPCRVDPPVQLYIDDNYITTINTDSSNHFSYTYSTSSSLSSGTHTIKAVSRLDCCAEGSGTDTFTVNAGCEARYLDDFQCSGNWRQRKYQNSDCSVVWQNYEYCSNDCSANQCVQCTAHYFDSFQCSGNWRQQLYQKSDCSVEWKNLEYCDNDCSAGHCITKHPCSVSASVTTPSDVRLGDTIFTTVSFYNSGEVGGTVDFDAHVCRRNGDNCQTMSCGGYYNDPSVYIPAGERRYLTCSMTANDLSEHKIKVDYSGCDRADPTIYSGTFEIESKPTCAVGYLNDFQCFGNWKQQQYQYSDCRTEWKNVLYCDDGCSGDKCTEPPKRGKPDISLDPEFTAYKCERNKFSFDITNVGEGRDSFDISFSDSASEWIKSVASVTLDPDETRTVKVYASVPCSADTGDYDLTITAVNGEKTSASTLITVADKWFTFPTGWFALSGWKIVFYVILFLLILGLILLLLLLFVWGLPSRRHKNNKGEGPEAFRPITSNSAVYRKMPESFLDRECRRR